MFMLSFKRVYPELYDKYKDNISIPVAGAERPAIDTKLPISSNSGLMLTHIIAEYYTAFYN
jgi:hypothetical protein